MRRFYKFVPVLWLSLFMACSGQDAVIAEGEKLLKEEKFTEAQAKFKEAIDAETSNPLAWVGRGQCKAHAGDLQGALDDYSKAAGKMGEDAGTDVKGKVHFYRGLGYFSLGQNEAALADFEKAIEYNCEELSMAYAYRGVIQGALGDDFAAIADLDKAIELDGTNSYALANRGYYNAKIGDNKNALADLSKVIELQPDDVMAYLNRGYTYMQSGSLQEAKKDFEKCLEIDPEYFGAITYMGICLTNLGQYGEALPYFNKAIQKQPDNPTLYYYRGSCLIFVGNKEAGCADLRHSIENGDPQGAALLQDNCGG